MIKSGFLIAAAGAALLCAQTQGPSPVPTPIGCHLKGVVSHTFYGKASDVNREIRNIESNIAGANSGRVFLVMIEAQRGSQVLYFEKNSDGQMLRTSWAGNNVRGLRAKLDDALLDSRGRMCAGVQMKSAVLALGNTRTKAVQATREDFARTMIVPVVATSEPTGFVRVTVFAPC